MRRQGFGRIVQHSSILGLIALRFRGSYNSSKYALEGYSDTLRLELQGSGIHLSTINTGPITSQFRQNAIRTFEQHIDSEHSLFREEYAEALQQRARSPRKKDPFQLGPEAVVEKLIHALESRRPKPRYLVTTASILLCGCKRILTTRQLDRLLRKIV